MKRAMCVGINYPDTDHTLRGCVNDAQDWAALFRRRGWMADVLLDGAATRNAILSGLDALVRQLQPVDTGAFTFSGHGTWVPDLSGDEADRRDEALCPVDMSEDGGNLILDDELAEVFARVPAGASLLFVSDCCHSGTVYRVAPGRPAGRRNRFLPPSHFLRRAELVRRMDRAFGQPHRPTRATFPGVLHFSGCRDNEFSADTEFEGRQCGAFSHFALDAFERVDRAGGSYEDVFRDVRTHLPDWEFNQTPALSGRAGLKRTRVFQ